MTSHCCNMTNRILDLVASHGNHLRCHTGHSMGRGGGGAWQLLTMLCYQNLELSGECDLEDEVEKEVSQGQLPWQSFCVMCGNLMFLSRIDIIPSLSTEILFTLVLSRSHTKEEGGKKNVRM